MTIKPYTFRLLLGFLLSILAHGMSAQDIHFSQFGNSPMNLSPALAGVFGGDMRFVGNYRNQWRTVRVPYTTFAGSVENKFYHKKGRYDRFFTGALMLNYDKQGSLNLTSLQIGIPITYTAPIAKNNFLTFGVTPAFGQRAFAKTNLTFDEQWVGCFYSPTAPITETGINNTNLKYFDFSGGINYRWQSAVKRHKFDLGGALHHINRPNHNFWTTTKDNRLASKMSFYGLGVIELGRKFDIMLQGMYQKQGTYKELVPGIAGRLHLNQKPYKELAISLGVDLRRHYGYNDAIIPHLEVFYKTWQAGFTYDINVSDFNVATDNRGGPEVSLIYRLYRVKPLPFFKSCPII